MDIGKRIRLRREELGYTQEELAFKLGYKSRSSVNKVENTRELSLKKLNSFAKALECNPGYLLGWEEKNDEAQAENYIFSKKFEIYENFGYDAYCLVDIYNHIEPNKKKELVNFANYLISNSDCTEGVMSEDELKKLKEQLIKERNQNYVVVNNLEKIEEFDVSEKKTFKVKLYATYFIAIS